MPGPVALSFGRRGQQRELRGAWEVLAGAVVIVDSDGHSVVAVGVRGDVLSAPEGYTYEALLDGSSMRQTDAAPDTGRLLAFTSMRARDAGRRVAIVRAWLGGMGITCVDFGRICGLSREWVGRHPWRGA